MAPPLDCDVVQVRLSGLRLHGRGNVVAAGWRAICGNSFNWMRSGRRACQRRGKQPAG
jgi:hypothetical protein